ncbi:reverse transcriptase domain protein [Diplodia corticola]|uniref:Reverse transcriptase domain protein n=1 Tax=Diplodia corticola TaxID=236234 RepID=A0A1J9R895_9PEZI|nr:reverse transcriptase domain protein [Diplodia corticola]OJD28611.1 reverse transcriptase domain protein [Diplodia corticola]
MNSLPGGPEEITKSDYKREPNRPGKRIRSSKSPYAAPVLLAKKPGGGLRFYVDYRALNALTIKNRYPIPLINETIDKLNKSKFFSTLDVVAAFNRIRIKEGDKEKTTFNTRYSQFEYTVMPFGLYNAPGTFQSYINDALREYLDDFYTAYLDNILNFGGQTRQEHAEYLKKIITRIKEYGLQLDIDKCSFFAKEVKYLNLIITTKGVHHRNLKHFITTKKLNKRQVKWAEFLSEFNFKISYRPGKQGEKPDSLTRRRQDLPEGVEDARTQHQFQTLLKDNQLEPEIRRAITLAAIILEEDKPTIISEEDESGALSDSKEGEVVADNLSCIDTRSITDARPTEANTDTRSIEERIDKAYTQDPVIQKVMQAKRTGQLRLPTKILAKGFKLSLSDLEVKDNKLYAFGKLYIPADPLLRTSIIKIHHDPANAGHGGAKPTYTLIARTYF